MTGAVVVLLVLLVFWFLSVLAVWTLRMRDTGEKEPGDYTCDTCRWPVGNGDPDLGTDDPQGWVCCHFAGAHFWRAGSPPWPKCRFWERKP